MSANRLQRLDHCPSCGIAAAGDGTRCIFCGVTLRLETVNEWRAVYHPHSYADAMLATAALRANGVTTRLEQCNLERVLLGRAGGVVHVAADEHAVAREVLRLVRGVRTDPEFLEWQALKRRPPRLGLALMVLVAGTALAAGVLLHLLRDVGAATTAPRQSTR
jgi:hypothetical protein